jgi:hypothetical protein
MDQEQSFDFSCANAALDCQCREVNDLRSLIPNGHATSDLLRRALSDNFDLCLWGRNCLVIGRNHLCSSDSVATSKPAAAASDGIQPTAATGGSVSR